jgi:hypothetical protein
VARGVRARCRATAPSRELNVSMCVVGHWSKGHQHRSYQRQVWRSILTDSVSLQCQKISSYAIIAGLAGSDRSSVDESPSFRCFA